MFWVVLVCLVVVLSANDSCDVSVLDNMRTEISRLENMVASLNAQLDADPKSMSLELQSCNRMMKKAEKERLDAIKVTQASAEAKHSQDLLKASKALDDSNAECRRLVSETKEAMKQATRNTNVEDALAKSKVEMEALRGIMGTMKSPADIEKLRKDIFSQSEEAFNIEIGGLKEKLQEEKRKHDHEMAKLRKQVHNAPSLINLMLTRLQEVMSVVCGHGHKWWTLAIAKVSEAGDSIAPLLAPIKPQLELLKNQMKPVFERAMPFYSTVETNVRSYFEKSKLVYGKFRKRGIANIEKIPELRQHAQSLFDGVVYSICGLIALFAIGPLLSTIRWILSTLMCCICCCSRRKPAKRAGKL